MSHLLKVWVHHQRAHQSVFRNFQCFWIIKVRLVLVRVISYDAMPVWDLYRQFAFSYESHSKSGSRNPLSHVQPAGPLLRPKGGLNSLTSGVTTLVLTHSRYNWNGDKGASIGCQIFADWIIRLIFQFTISSSTWISRLINNSWPLLFTAALQDRHRPYCICVY